MKSEIFGTLAEKHARTLCVNNKNEWMESAADGGWTWVIVHAF